MTKNYSIKICVHPDFRKKIKAESAMKGLSIIEYSKLLSKKKFLQEDETGEEPKFGFRL
jgi:hypothetical protein